MRAVILAAGSARRLSPLTDTLHKSLLKIGDKTIMEYQLDACNYYGIQKVLIVVGYLKEQIIGKFGNKYRQLQIEYIENPDYATTNTVYSLWLAREFFRNEDFIYFNADVLFHHSLLEVLLNSTAKTALGVEVKPCGEEEVKVITDSTKKILRIGKKLDPAKCLGEFVGIAKFNSNLTEDFAIALKQVIDNGDENAFFEKAVDMILEKHEHHYEDITHIPVIEIDFPEDLKKARSEVLSKMQNYQI